MEDGDILLLPVCNRFENVQINPLPRVRFKETFFRYSPWPAESLKTIKSFDAIFWVRSFWTTD